MKIGDRVRVAPLLIQTAEFKNDQYGGCTGTIVERFDSLFSWTTIGVRIDNTDSKPRWFAPRELEVI